MLQRLAQLAYAAYALGTFVTAYRVPIADTDAVREVCSGMWGGKDASIELSFNPASSGQVALVIYEWKDVQYLGAQTHSSEDEDESPRTYICTTSAVRSGLCTSTQLGSFITSLPEGKALDTTSIYTSALKFSTEDDGDANEPYDDDAPLEQGSDTNQDQSQDQDTPSEDQSEPLGQDDGFAAVDDFASVDGSFMEDGVDVSDFGKRQIGDMIGGITGSLSAQGDEDDQEGGQSQEDGQDGAPQDGDLDGTNGDQSGEDEPEQTRPDDTVDLPQEAETGGEAGTYAGPITYKVPKTGYYCVGIVPVTLVNSRRTLDRRQSATHAEYSGLVTFHNVFDGELPAVEYPKIGFYFLLSIVYAALGLGWGYLCFKHRDELLPMQYYISGTTIFLVIEMLANFAYYRYINKHGGGATSLAFLFVVSVLNAARNSLSFFLLLIVSMGLSVVRQSLGSIMTKVRILTGFHFVFGVLYSVGTVQVELDSAALFMVMLLIFPLALTLTAFLMWIIVSLNSTIMFLQSNKQRMKLQMFQRLWRILIMAVIAIAAFFVVSSLSLSNRLDENYAPNNWRYRWILLDGSLAIIYLAVFAGIAWIWRPTANNRSFSMSQELAQDEDEADAEDYEIDTLERGDGLGRGAGHQPLGQGDGFDDDDDDEVSKPFGRHSGPRGGVGEENTVFALDDSDEEGSEDGKGGKGAQGEAKGGKGGKGGYRDSDEEGEGRARKRRDS